MVKRVRELVVLVGAATKVGAVAVDEMDEYQ